MDYYTIILLIIVAFAVFVAFYVLIKSKKGGLSTEEQEFIKKKWSLIEVEVKTNPNNAVLEADKLLGHMLKVLGYEGNIGEQLKSAKALFKDIDNVWAAHKIRNRLAHEMGVKLKPGEAKRTLRMFKQAIQDLGGKI